MSDRSSLSESRYRSLSLRCKCTCSFLVVEAWDVDKSDTEWFAEVYKRPAKAHWRWRIKNAVGLIFGKEPVIDDLCFGSEEIVQLRDFLNECYPVAE